MNQTSIATIIDEGLERFAARDLVAGHEVVDFLLDLRLAVFDDSELRELLEQETAPMREIEDASSPSTPPPQSGRGVYAPSSPQPGRRGGG